MPLAAVHLDPRISVPTALILTLLALWQLGRAVAPDTPPSRTRIRRVSMLVRIALLVPVVVGLSFADPALHPLRYVWSWGLAMVLLALSFLVTGLDMANTVRVRAVAERELAMDALTRTLQAEVDRHETS